LAAGFLRCSVRDMLSYAEIYRTGGCVGSERILSEESVKAMTRPYAQAAPGMYYGYGLMLTPEYNGVSLVEHGGALKGIAAHFSVVPEQGLTAVFLTNLAGVPSSKTLLGALNAALGLSLAKERATFGEYVAPSAETLAQYTGIFRSGESEELKVTVEDGQLFFEIQGKRWASRAVDDHTFLVRVKAIDSPAQFLFDADGKVYAMAFHFRIIRKVAGAFDLIIRNGLIVDGTGNPWYKADIGVKDDCIVTIGAIADTPGAKVIDAAGRVVSPGFIDMHSHSDLMVFVEPMLPAKVQQGITLDVLTQDGISVAPVNTATKPVWRKMLAGLDGDPPIEWDWESLGEYMAALDRAKPGINLATMIPYGNVRAQVVGFEPVTPNAAQLEQMKALVEQSMQEGAFGMSLGLIYQPQMYATKEELIELYKVVAKYRGIMQVHTRNEGDLLLEAADEVIEICMTAGCPLHISHIKAAGMSNWEKGPLLLAKMERARARGLDVTFDQYPYTAGSTFLHASLPPWATEGGVEKTVARLKDPEQRARMAWEIEHMVGANRPTTDPTLLFWDNFVASAGWDGVMITSVTQPQNKALEGRTLADIAAERGQSPADIAFDLLIDEECKVSMAVFISSEENVMRFLAHEYGTIGTDGLLVGKPHPRAYGSFPRILGTYVREQGLLSLPQMIRRMTSLPAQRLGLQDRGILRTGFKADMVIFDPETIGEVGTYADPRRFPTGIQAVVVNGAVAVENGELTGARRGEVLRRAPGRNFFNYFRKVVGS
jgi:N-acyl-D-amino-acid deacylase